MRAIQIFVTAVTAMALLAACGSNHPTCAEAGGTCVPVVPDSCAIGTAVSPDRYACDPNADPQPVGVTCCLPPDAGVN